MKYLRGQPRWLYWYVSLSAIAVGLLVECPCQKSTDVQDSTLFLAPSIDGDGITPWVDGHPLPTVR